MFRTFEKKVLRKPLQAAGTVLGLRDKKEHHSAAPTARPVPSPAEAVPTSVTPEVTELKGSLDTETARADEAVQQLGEVKQALEAARQELQETKETIEQRNQQAERLKLLKSVGKKMARTAASKYLKEHRYDNAAEFVDPITSTEDTVTINLDFSKLNPNESKAIIKSVLHSGRKIVSLLLSNEKYVEAGRALNEAVMWCNARKPALTQQLVVSGSLCFSEPESEIKYLAEPADLQLEEESLAKQLTKTIAQLALVEQPEPMTTDGQSASEYLEAEEPNPALLFASQMPLPPFIAQPEVRADNPPVQKDDAAVTIRIAAAS